ncbi:MAG: tetratricopeptide repeat protein, partial [Acidobacteriota bacterium]
LEVEREQASRGPVVVEGWRGDVALRVELPAGYWGLVTRPTLPVDDTELYQAARLQLAGGEVEGAVERLRQLATRLHRAGRLAEAAWMAYETADALAAAQRWGEASAALHAGLADAHASGDRRFVAWGHERKGALLLRRSELAGAAEQYRRALALREQLPGSVAEIEILTRLGRLAIDRGDFDEAQQLLDRALVLGRARAPGSLAVAETRGQLAVIFGLRSEFDAAMEHMLAALETQQRLAPHSVFVVQTLNRLGLASRRLGRLADAETYYRAALGIQQTLDPMGFQHRRGPDQSRSAGDPTGPLAPGRGDFLALVGDLRSGGLRDARGGR